MQRSWAPGSQKKAEEDHSLEKGSQSQPEPVLSLGFWLCLFYFYFVLLLLFAFLKRVLQHSPDLELTG